MEKALQLFAECYKFDPSYLPHKLSKHGPFVVIDCPDGRIVITMDGRLSDGEYVDYDMYGETVIAAAKYDKECEELRKENANLRAENANLRAENANLRAENANLRAENAENADYQEALARFNAANK